MPLCELHSHNDQSRGLDQSARNPIDAFGSTKHHRPITDRKGHHVETHQVVDYNQLLEILWIAMFILSSEHVSCFC